MRGTFEAGKFRRCAEWPKGVPQCMGRASAGGEHFREEGAARCTCWSFATDQMRFAKEHGLTIDERLDVPEEWRAERSAEDAYIARMGREIREQARTAAREQLAVMLDKAARIVESRENRMVDRAGLGRMIRKLDLPRLDEDG